MDGGRAWGRGPSGAIPFAIRAQLLTGIRKVTQGVSSGAPPVATKVTSGTPEGVRQLDPAAIEELRPLVRDYRFNPYRNYRAFSAQKQADVLIAEMTSASEGLVFFSGTGDSRAAAV